MDKFPHEDMIMSSLMRIWLFIHVLNSGYELFIHVLNSGYDYKFPHEDMIIYPCLKLSDDFMPISHYERGLGRGV